jgi:hypothetical protein
MVGSPADDPGRWDNRVDGEDAMSEDFQSKVIFLATQTITKRQSDILRKLLAGESLALEHGNAWIGDERTSQRTIDALLRFCAISTDWSGARV